MGRSGEAGQARGRPWGSRGGAAPLWDRPAVRTEGRAVVGQQQPTLPRYAAQRERAGAGAGAR